jgi:hypothetical protein
MPEELVLGWRMILWMVSEDGIGSSSDEDAVFTKIVGSAVSERCLSLKMRSPDVGLENETVMVDSVLSIMFSESK